METNQNIEALTPDTFKRISVQVQGEGFRASVVMQDESVQPLDQTYATSEAGARIKAEGIISTMLAAGDQ